MIHDRIRLGLCCLLPPFNLLNLQHPRQLLLLILNPKRPLILAQKPKLLQELLPRRIHRILPIIKLHNTPISVPHRIVVFDFE